MKAGQIVENYGGKFAKIIRVSDDGGMFSLSAWVRSREAAEVETVADITLNDFGLSQVLKGGQNVEVSADAAAQAEGTERKPLAKMNAEELKAYATELGIDPEGTKAVVTERITAHLDAAAQAEGAE